MKKRYIPNLLSLSRIPCSIALPFLAGRYAVSFLVCYFVAGIADVLDGVLARRFHWESRLGAKMDSVGDGVFIVCVVIAAILSLGPALKEEGGGIALYCYAMFGVLVAVKLVNIAFTRAKFKQWGFLHLRSARWAAIPLYVLFPVCIHFRKVYNIPVVICLALSVLACLEEIGILIIMERHEYTMNIKSIVEWRRDKRRTALEISAAPAREEEAAV